MDRETHAIQALFRTLRDKLPAKLAALDAARRARVVCIPGPYAITAGVSDELRIGTELFTLTAGSARTAAQIATELNDADPTGWTASADADGALVLTGDAAPTASAPSQIHVKGGTANDPLGIVELDSSSVVLALNDPKPRLLPRAPHASDVAMKLSPLIAVRRDGAQWDRPLNSDLTQVRLELHVVFPGAMGELTSAIEGLRALCGAIYRVVEEGDGRGTYKVGRGYATESGMEVVVCRPLPMTIEPVIIPGLEDAGRVPLAQGYPAFEVEVFDQ